MGPRYLAFDIETAKDVPGEDFNWRPHRPLGICCAATLASDQTEPRLWYGKESDGSPSPRMSPSEAFNLVEYLLEMARAGYVILTWNGLGFDFDILAEESDAHGACRDLAMAHVDMMFQVLCIQGFPIGIDKAAKAMGLRGKPDGMSGEKAPRLWVEGRFDVVLGYVAQDVRTAIEVAQICDRRRSLSWITRRGDRKSMSLNRGWLAVRDALLLPEPDTSWMSSPLSRQEVTAWMKR